MKNITIYTYWPLEATGLNNQELKRLFAEKALISAAGTSNVIVYVFADRGKEFIFPMELPNYTQ